MTVREHTEKIERDTLSQHAVLASASRGREREEEPCPMRTCFQRDVDRIIHSKAFRRLKDKTQVFLSPEGDHYRTRLTHTLEVTRIARTIARALRLNEDLVEAIGLGHDLGHTPFGHAGEFELNDIVEGGFTHNGQGARVVRLLEKGGRGLNLSLEVVEGIQCHTGPVKAATLEGKLIKFADRIAYINHDIDDAIRAGILSEEDIPKDLSRLLGNRYNIRIDTMVADVIANSLVGDDREIRMSETIGGAMLALREFMFENVYKNPVAKGEESRARDMLHFLYEYYVSHPENMPDEYLRIAEAEGVSRAVADYIAGMTDQYAVTQFKAMFVPKGWG
ncbi:deoxyguanosinetriphosphate triphosphohydrolase [Oscillospiraceae bacterium OttesenSCG-928-G22]|nr:deoxyguanosinetriphosphate triphosphohydrolase [Oscillospiraceae bacterium OttesenSCG-928-G22]